MNNNAIPKIIHYCWFGGGEKPEYFKEYIKSWEKILYDYKIIEWNEKNFDVNFCKFSQQAYSQKKYAFVSDVARLYALYHHGGIYLDTDVEVIKSFSDLIGNKECIFGFETENKIATSFMATNPNNQLIKEFLELYLTLDFIKGSGNFEMTPNVIYLTELLKKNGLEENGEFQKLDNGIFVYPKSFFSPYDYIYLTNNICPDSYCVHYFRESWYSTMMKLRKKLKLFLIKLLGLKRFKKLRMIKNSILK